MPMDIPTYLKTRRLTQARFGEMIGVSQALVSRWCNDPETVTPEWAAEIERRTRRAIRREEIRPKIFA